MTIPSDTDDAAHGLSLNARRMRELQEPVLQEWERRLRATVKQATHLSPPIIIDTVPMFYGNLVEAITPPDPRVIASGTSTVASEHGGERARLTNYTIDAVVAEYQLLRWTIFDVLATHGVVLQAWELTVINTTIDKAIQESVTAFALSQSKLREQFMVSMAHDLRSPLHVVGTAAEVILRVDDVPKIHDMAKRIKDNSERMDRMIKELLDIAMFSDGRRQHLNLTGFDILSVISEVCEQSNAVGEFRIKIDAQSVVGWWDRNALKRAIENLLSNAVKYGDPDAPISVTTEVVHERLLLSVHNEGDPIPPEEWETVFQVYHRAQATKSGARQGWGIGLPYVRSVAESHGGSVVLDSSREKGTTLSLDIPLDARPFQQAPTSEGA